MQGRARSAKRRTILFVRKRSRLRQLFEFVDFANASSALISALQCYVAYILNNLTTARAGGPGYGYGPGPYPDAVIVNPVTGRWCGTESNGYQICWTP